jgi:hypothetical protein
MGTDIHSHLLSAIFCLIQEQQSLISTKERETFKGEQLV